jgi:signal transduction histidine kinase
MSPETRRWERERACRWLFALLALIVPALVGYDVGYQFRTPTLDFFLSGHDSTLVGQVMPGGRAEAAGLRAGDVILTIDGVPAAEWYHPQLGQTHVLKVERDGERLTFAVSAVSAGQLHPLSLAIAVAIVLTFWGSGVLLLLRRFQQPVVRLLFLLVQVIAIALLTLLAHASPVRSLSPFWFVPDWLQSWSFTCFWLIAPLMLHYCLTFPVRLGAPRQRRWGLGLLYGLALLPLAGVWLHNRLLTQLGTCYTVLSVAVAAVALIYIYRRRATPDDRRRLRIVVLGTLLATVLPIFFYGIPLIAGAPRRMPAWLMGLFLVAAPLSYLYATARHNLFGIDRLLNRALVYALLSLGIFVLYLGPFLLLYRLLPGDLLIQTTVVAGLTLLVGLSFNWARSRVQRLVDRLFYGGWYDYPGVVETISDALARSIERAQLTDVLIRQAPSLMQLHDGQLWIGEPGDAPPEHPIETPLCFPLTFREQIRGLWRVGRRRDGEDLTASDRRILKTLARQAEVALSNVLLVEMLRCQLDEIRASRETLAQAQRQLLRSREQERARLARDLHDDPIQSLVGLNLQLGLLLVQAEPSPAGEATILPVETLSAMRAEVRQLLTSLRQVCAELRPPMLDTLGLGAALRALAEDWSAQCNVAVRLDLPPDATLRPLPDEVAVNLYRVTQEALANVARHAAARQVVVRLAWQDAHLSLTLQDDGRGFIVPDTLHRLAAEGHFGLVGMQERVNLIGGAWTVDSTPGQGTTVHIVWPHTIFSPENGTPVPPLFPQNSTPAP